MRSPKPSTSEPRDVSRLSLPAQRSPARPAQRLSARRPRLVALGDLVLDVVIRPDAPLVSGSDVPGTLAFRAGGSAANVCRAFAGLGGSAVFVGAVGDDGVGRRLAGSLRRDGVRVRSVAVKAPTARLAALIGPRGERTFVTQRGAADQLRQGRLNRAWFRGADFLHLPAYSLLKEPLASATSAATGHARAAGVVVSLDLASRGPLLAEGRDVAHDRIRQVAPDLILCNLDEAEALAGRRGVRRLLDLAPVLVIKEGPAGCRVLWRRAHSGSDDVLELDVATTPIDTPDTTGAGDAFDAGFLHSLAEQTPEGRTRPRTAGQAAERAESMRRPQVLRRAAVAGHRAAARLLSRPRPELVL